MQPGSWQPGSQKEPAQTLEVTGQHLSFFKMHKPFTPAVPYQSFTPQITPHACIPSNSKKNQSWSNVSVIQRESVTTLEKYIQVSTMQPCVR